MAAPTYFGSVAVPVDGASATNATATITVTPPASMLTGDLVVVVCSSLNSATWSNGVTGGQTWTAETAFAGTAGPYCRLFWCRFNGTWAANPRFDSTSATSTSAIMHVFRPDATTKLWAFDVAQASTAFAAPSTPFTVTRTGLTTAHADCVSLACWASSDDNTWGTLSGTGWTLIGTQYRNTAGQDQSLAFARHLDSATSTAVPNVSLNQATLGGDAGVTAIMSWYAYAPVGAYIVQSKDIYFGNQTSVPLTFDAPTTAGNAILAIFCQGTSATSPAPPAITDNNGGTYGTVDVTFNPSDERLRLGAYLSSNITGRSGHIVTLTFTEGTWCSGRVYELSNVPTSALVTGVVEQKMGTTAFTDQFSNDLVADNDGLWFAALCYAAASTSITPNWSGATQDIELDESNLTNGDINILTKPAVAGVVEKARWTLGAGRSTAIIAFAIRNAGTTVPSTAGKVIVSQSQIKTNAVPGILSHDISFYKPTTAGCAVLVIFCGWSNDGLAAGTVTVSDNNGGSYTALVDFVFGVNNKRRMGAYLATNLTGRSGHVVTVAFSKATWLPAKIYELTNVPTSSLITGTTTTNTGNSTAATGGSVTPADSGLHFAACGSDGGQTFPNWTSGSDDSLLDPSGVLTGNLSILKKAAVGSSAQNPAWTLQGANWGAFNLAIKAAPFVLTDNLVGYWKLDEASGSRADSSGLGSTLIETQGPGTVSNRTGKIGLSAYITGGVNRLTCASNANLQVGDIDFTIALWAFPDTTTPDSTIFCKAFGAFYEYDVFWHAAKFGFYIDRGGPFGFVEWGSTSSVSAWHFVVAIHDSVNDLVKVSVDNGTFVTSSFAGGATIAGTAALMVGSAETSEFFTGLIDEVGIWKRALSASEITTLYNGGAGLTYPFTAPAGLTKSISDGLSLSDIRAGAAGFVRARTEAMSLAEALARLAQYLRSLSDPLALGETSVRNAQFKRSLSDAAALADALAKVIGRGLVDPIALGDVSARVAGFVRNQSEPLTLGDASVRAAQRARSLSDALALGDVPTRLAGFVRSLSDALVLGDARSALVVIRRALADGLSINELIVAKLLLTRSISESVSLGEVVTKLLAIKRSMADGMSLSEAVAASVLRKSVGDSLILGELVGTLIMMAGAISVHDGLTLNESVKRVAFLIRSYSDPLALADSLVKAMGRFRSLSDTIFIGELVDRIAVLARSPIEPLSLLDAIEKLLALVRSRNEPIVLADVVQTMVIGAGAPEHYYRMMAS